MAEYRADAKTGEKNGADEVDVVFMDPPRAGSDEAFLSSVVTLAPKRVVYVSCNPETLARDLLYLTKQDVYKRQVISICAGWNFRMKENKTQKKIQISIRAKILVGMVVCTLIVANLSGWFLMNRAKTMLLEQCKQNAGSSAKLAAQRSDGDLLEQLQACLLYTSRCV